MHGGGTGHNLVNITTEPSKKQVKLQKKSNKVPMHDKSFEGNSVLDSQVIIEEEGEEQTARPTHKAKRKNLNPSTTMPNSGLDANLIRPGKRAKSIETTCTATRRTQQRSAVVTPRVS